MEIKCPICGAKEYAEIAFIDIDPIHVKVCCEGCGATYCILYTPSAIIPEDEASFLEGIKGFDYDCNPTAIYDANGDFTYPCYILINTAETLTRLIDEDIICTNDPYKKYDWASPRLYGLNGVSEEEIAIYDDVLNDYTYAERALKKIIGSL